MTRYGWTILAISLGIAQTPVRADFGGPLPPQPMPASPPVNYQMEAEIGYEKGIYGTHPMLRKLLFWKKDGGKVHSHTHTRPLPPPNTALPGSPGVGMPGTLVFPYNPYVRAPRDFFMYEPGARR